NHIERLNKELKRRSSVIGIFPNENSLMRLMGSVLLERNDAVIAKKAIFSPATYAKMIKSKTVAELKELAEEQQKLRAA
ncbi:MAG: transposase, partial [Ligilactobacillus ruminis]|nr:transposase [Ligilactobacillus ruminis]